MIPCRFPCEPPRTCAEGERERVARRRRARQPIVALVRGKPEFADDLLRGLLNVAVPPLPRPAWWKLHSPSRSAPGPSSGSPATVSCERESVPPLPVRRQVSSALAQARKQLVARNSSTGSDRSPT